MDFDEVLEELGELGNYQLTNYILICLPVFFSAANSLSYVFVAGVPDYRWINIYLIYWNFGGLLLLFENFFDSWLCDCNALK